METSSALENAQGSWKYNIILNNVIFMAVEVFYTWLEVQSIDVTFITPLNHLSSSAIS